MEALSPAQLSQVYLRCADTPHALASRRTCRIHRKSGAGRIQAGTLPLPHSFLQYAGGAGYPAIRSAERHRAGTDPRVPERVGELAQEPAASGTRVHGEKVASAWRPSPWYWWWKTTGSNPILSWRSSTKPVSIRR